MNKNIQNININNYQIQKHQSASELGVKTSPIKPKQITHDSLNFSGFFNRYDIPVKLKSTEDKEKYKIILDLLDKEDQHNLDILSKTGRLFSRNSNDKSTTLDNLYKIAISSRAQGLDKNIILKDTIKTLANPFRINQHFGYISQEMARDVLNKPKYKDVIRQITDIKKAPVNSSDFNIDGSATCVAASIEFNLADKKPAEFARYVQELTSPSMSVTSKIQYKNISKNIEDAIQILTDFKLENKIIDWENVEVQLKPDKAAIIRAMSQSNNNLVNTRNTVDVLMQSTFMQAGSVNSYNSLTDERHGGFNLDIKGLTEYEKTFVESVVNNIEGGKTSLTYQIVDDNKKITGYNYDFETTKQHLIKSLENSSNVIVGITETDENNIIIGGHEITVIDHKTDENGELLFVCNDTDDNYFGKNIIKASDLIPMIHHAGVPSKILDIEEEEYAYEMLKEFNNKQVAN